MANNYETNRSTFSFRQRAVSLTLGVASGLPLCSAAAVANVQPPLPPNAFTSHVPMPNVVNHAAPAALSTVAPVTSHTATSHTSWTHLHTLVTPTPTGANLNLASASPTFLAGNLANFSSLTIDVAGKQEQVNLNTKLTSAEVVAVEQVITGGGQSIVIGRNGAATGGTVSLNNNLLTALDTSLGGSISSLTVAKGVQVVDSLSNLSLSGRLTNYGSIVTASGAAGATDSISAGTIVNASSGNIGSYGGGGGLYAADPSLSAATSITNSGAISSAGNLTLSAPVVSNLGGHGAPATISAAQNVNIGTANLSNSGVIAALTGNVNLVGNGGLNMQGAGGTIQAANGNINLSGGGGDIDVNGGNFLSQQVNFNGGTGNVTAQMDQVSGVVNANGDCVHINGNSSNLDLGSISASGDPTITNTGNLDISGGLAVTSGNALTLIAGGNIVSDSPNSGIDTSSAGNGGQINLIAGAAFTPNVTANPAATVTVTKGSATGGSIDLTGNSGGTGPITSITSAGGGGTGGNIQMIAFAGSVKGSGVVTIPSNVAVNASGTTTSGNVTIIAGAKSGTAISTGAITGNNVTVDAATPTITAAKGTTGVTFAANGTQQNAGTNFFGPAKTANAGNIILGNQVETGKLNIFTAGNATVTDTGASALNLGTVTVGAKGIFSATTGTGVIDVTGDIVGGTANITNTGANAGDTLLTNVANLVLNTNGNVTDTQGTSTMLLSGTVAGAASKLAVTSSGQINVNSPLFVNGAGSELDLTASAKGGINIGAAIFMGGTGTVNLNNNGTGKLTEAKGISLDSKTVSITSTSSFGAKAQPFATNASVNLNVNLTGANSAKSIAYVSDGSTGTLNFEGNNPASTKAVGGSLFLTSAASQLNVGDANYNIVSITNTQTSGTGVDFNNAAGVLGTGAKGSSFTVVSATNITDSAAAVLNGLTVNLNATGSLPANGGVGTFGKNIILNSPTITLNSAQGNVYVTDKTAATVNGAASLVGTFSVNDIGVATGKVPESLIVGKSVGGGTIDLTTTAPAGAIALNGTVGTATTANVNVNSAGAVTTKGAIQGANIGITGAGVTVGGAMGNAVSDITVTSTSTSGITITGKTTGNNLTFIADNGPITTKATITGSGANSSITLDGTASTPTGNAVIVGAAITGGTINLGLSKNGQGNVEVNSAVGNSATTDTTIDTSVNGTGLGGSITGTALITGSNVTLTAANSIGTSAKPVNTAAGSLSANSNGTGTGAGAFVTQKGNLTLGNSTDANLVVKATGTLDVVGTVVAPSLNLSSTGAVTVDGTIQNTTGLGSTTGSMVITAGGAFTISPSGKIITTNDTMPVTVNVTGASTINGTVNVQTFDLNTKAGLNLGTTGVLNDGTDNITSSGPVVVNGTVGTVAKPAVFNVTTTGSFTFGPGITVNAGGAIKAATIINYATLNGNLGLSMDATGAGNAFINYANITGLNITLTTSNSKGVLFNAPGATIIASEPALQAGAPTINLNSYNVNNQGTIQAIGMAEQFQGTLNFTSPGALTITGPTGSFGMNYFSAVNLTAKGNITVGGVVNGNTVNPFSLFNAANELGTFSVNTTGTFSSPMPGVSVVTNTLGTFGGNISITASNVLYNGTGATPVFALSAIGAGPTLSTGKAPITLDITGSQGITIGNSATGAAGRYTVLAEGYGNTSLTTITTPGVLYINTDPSFFNVNFTSLALTGNSRVLINGNLDEGTQKSTLLTITTLSAAPFLVGGASSTNGNGQFNITTGQGISAGVLTINAPGLVTVGAAATKTTPEVDAVLNGTASVTLNSTSLTVNNNSDISGLILTLNNVNATNTTYTNLNTGTTGAPGGISASELLINDGGGVVTLVSGAKTPGGQAELSIGTNPNGPAISGVQLSGGEFKINAQGLVIPSNGLNFNATGGIDGGQVFLNLTGTSVNNGNITVGLAAGQISANVADTNGALQPNGTGFFEVTTPGNIIVQGLTTSANMSSSSINLGPIAGNLSFNSTTGTVFVNGSLLLKSVDAAGLGLNLFEIVSNSMTPLNAQGASSGGNGISGGTSTNPVQIFGGNIFLQNSGTIVSNGVVMEGGTLNFTSSTGIDLSGNSGLTSPLLAYVTGGASGTVGGTINLSAPYITVGKYGLALVAQGGQTSGGSITVATSVTPIAVGQVISGVATQNVQFDVGDMQTSPTGGNLVAGSVNITSPGNLLADGRGIIFQDAGMANPGTGGTLTLTSTGVSGGAAGTLTLTNASAMTGLNFSTVVLNSGSSAPFLLNTTSTSGNGVVNTLTSPGILIAGSIKVNAALGSINTTGEVFYTNSLSLTAPSVTFGAGQVITLQPDTAFATTEPDTVNVGFTGFGSTAATGNGGTAIINAAAFAFGKGGVSFVAPGEGAASQSANSVGGSITIVDNQVGTANLAINGSTFAGFNVSNQVGGLGGQKAGNVTITNPGNVSITASSSLVPTTNGSLFTYGATGGSLTVTAPNISITGVAALSKASQDTTGGNGLASISLTTDSATPFSVSGAATTNGNGFTDTNPTLLANGITIVNNFVPPTGKTTGGINYTGGDNVQANNLTLTTAGAITFAAGESVTALASAVPVTIVNPPPAPPTIIPTGTGGSITISAASINVTTATTGAVTFNAIGNTTSSAGAGGNISITLTGKNTVNIGTATGDLAFNVGNTGGFANNTAGTVSVVNGGSIVADATGLTYGPTEPTGSGTLALTGTNLLISQVASLNPYNLASITLTSTSSSDFVFGGATGPTGNGFADPGATTLSALALTIDANATATPGVTTLLGGINTSGPTTVNVHQLNLSTLNTITLVSGTGLTVAADPTSGAGGSITLTAGAYAFTVPGTGALLSAKGGAGGSGGTITVNDTGTALLNIGSTGLSFNVAGAAGQSAGTVNVTTAGDMVVDGGAFTFGPSPATGNAGSGALSLSSVDMLINNIAPLNTFPLETLTISTASNIDFSMSGATLNGFSQTSPTALTAASITINANTKGTNSGGIVVGSNAIVLDGTKITLDTLNTITFAAGTTLTAIPVQPGGAGGSITIDAGAVSFGATGTTLNAKGATGGGGGTIDIVVASTGTLVVGSAGFTMDVTNAGGGTGGTISVFNGGALTVDGNAISVGSGFPALSGANVTLNANGVLAVSNATNFVSVANMGTLVFSSDSAQTFTMGGAAAGSNGITDNTLDFIASTLLGFANQGGAIALGTAKGLDSNTAMNLAASTDIGSTLQPIVFDQGGGLQNKQVNITAGGNVDISVTGKAGTQISTATIIGALTLTSTGGGDLAVGATGVAPAFSTTVVSANNVSITTSGGTNNLYLGDVTAFDGSLTVASDAATMTLLQQANILATNGNITLQDTNAGSNIVAVAGFETTVPGQPPVITPGATVRASAPTPLITDGNVTIVIGGLAFAPSPGVTPVGGPTIIINDNGSLTFGANPGNVNGSIKVSGPTVSLEALGRNLIFNTANTNAISLGDFTTITADPPGSAGVISQAGLTASTLPNSALMAGTVVPVAMPVLSSVNSGSSASAASVLNASAFANTATAINESGPQPSFSLANSASTLNVSASASSLAGINNLSVNSSTLGANGLSGSASIDAGHAINGGFTGGDNGLSTGFLGSSSTNATVESINDGASVVGSGSGNKSSAGKASFIGPVHTLRGEVSNTLHRTINRGPILLSPLQNEVIETPFGTVSVAAHSVVLLISLEDGLAVYNLHDNRKNAVLVNNGTSVVPVTPGRSAVLTSSGKSFAEINPVRFVSYRRVASQETGGGMKLHQADFDILSIVRGLPNAINPLMKSQDAGTRKAMEAMLKTAAIMSQIYQGNEAYALYLPPDLTAYAGAPSQAAQH